MSEQKEAPRQPDELTRFKGLIKIGWIVWLDGVLLLAGVGETIKLGPVWGIFTFVLWIVFLLYRIFYHVLLMRADVNMTPYGLLNILEGRKSALLGSK